LDLKSIQQHLATKFRDSWFYLQNFDCGGPGTTSPYLNRCSLLTFQPENPDFPGWQMFGRLQLCL